LLDTTKIPIINALSQGIFCFQEAESRNSGDRHGELASVFDTRPLPTAITLAGGAVYASGHSGDGSFITGMDSSGSALYDTSVAGRGATLALAADGEGNVVFGGSLGSAVEIGMYSSNLEEKWRIASGEEANGWVSDVAVDPTGRIIFSGMSQSGFNFPAGGEHIESGSFAGVSSADGDVIWIDSVPVPSASGPPELALLPNGRIVVATPFLDEGQIPPEHIMFTEFDADLARACSHYARARCSSRKWRLSRREERSMAGSFE